VRAEVEASAKAHAALATWIRQSLDNPLKDLESQRESRYRNVRRLVSWLHFSAKVSRYIFFSAQQYGTVEKMHKQLSHQWGYVNKVAFAFQ
jgi:hypothetical protein